jgi:S1-C subfamily serine protease
MRKVPLYSRSPRPTVSSVVDSVPASETATPESPPVTAASHTDKASATPRRRWRQGALLGAAALALLAGGIGAGRYLPSGQVITQADIDKSVRKTLENNVFPSNYTRAYMAVARSVVLVEGRDDEPAPVPDLVGKKPAPKGDEEDPGKYSTGTGVVIVDNGTILTNLHVVAGAKRLRVTFADGTDSDASLVGVQPEHDLAVLRAKSIPDDLQAATMRSTADLLPGDEVIAVGYPFGIGPSVSGGVVSGMKREFRSPHGGQKKLTNLIQFDAAANPGNSGGPLVTMDGSVVGIVTAILNPTDARTFIGIGFAVPIENAAAAAGMPPF